MTESLLCIDFSGRLRGRHKTGEGCKCLALKDRSAIPFKAAYTSENKDQELCENCGGSAADHENLEDWLNEVRRWLQRIVASDDSSWGGRVPTTFQLPALAKDWEPAAAAFNIITHGQFDPDCDGGRPINIADGRCPARELISVICPTIEKHHACHRLLYECFSAQTYPERELIVIDTGTRPSEFLQARANEDPRVVYRFFHVAEHGLEQEEDPLEHVLKADDPQEVLQWLEVSDDMPETDYSEVWWSGWSRGLKRNLACYLARGAVLANFNIGDLYGPAYLDHMREQLLSGMVEPAHPAAVALSAWHGLDFCNEAFRLFDPVEGKAAALPQDKRQEFQCAHGFSCMFTRPAWEQTPFLDVEEPERQLVKMFEKDEQVSFKLVRLPPDGLAAHGYDKDSASGAHAAASINLSCEMWVFDDYSVNARLPPALKNLMPLVKEVVLRRNSQKEDRIGQLLCEHGPTFFCVQCDAAVALRKFHRENRRLSDGGTGFVDVLKFSRAGGAVAEGEATYEEPAPPVARPAQNTFSAFGQHGRQSQFGYASGLQGFRPPSSAFAWKSGRAGAHATGMSGSTAFRSAVGRAGPMGLGTIQQQQADKHAWWPGWFSRNAMCRRCGNPLGWRYERDGLPIFWALEKKHLKERTLPERVQMPHTLSPASNNLQTGEPTEVVQRETTRCGTTSPGQSLTPAGSSPAAVQHDNRADAFGGTLQKGLQVIATFSPALQELLARELASCDKAKFDQALNKLELDDATSKQLHEELMIRPGVDAKQVERQVAKHFKGKVNILRSLGLQALCAALKEVLPSDILDELGGALEAIITSQGETRQKRLQKGSTPATGSNAAEKLPETSKSPRRSPRHSPQSQRGRHV